MEKKQRERLRLPYSAEELEARCSAYFERCGEEERKCTRPGLILFLRLPEETFDGLLHSEEKRHAQASQVLQRAMLRMRDELEQRGDTKSVFLLKQQCYGGYQDKPGERGETQVRVFVTFGEGAQR